MKGENEATQCATRIFLSHRQKKTQAAYVVQFYERHILDTWIFLFLGFFCCIFGSIDICIDFWTLINIDALALIFSMRVHVQYIFTMSIYNIFQIWCFFLLCILILKTWLHFEAVKQPEILNKILLRTHDIPGHTSWEFPTLLISNIDHMNIK